MMGLGGLVKKVANVGAATLGFGVGGATGAALAYSVADTGKAPSSDTLKKTVAIDAAALAGGYGYTLLSAPAGGLAVPATAEEAFFAGTYTPASTTTPLSTTLGTLAKAGGKVADIYAKAIAVAQVFRNPTNGETITVAPGDKIPVGYFPTNQTKKLMPAAIPESKAADSTALWVVAGLVVAGFAYWQMKG